MPIVEWLLNPPRALPFCYPADGMDIYVMTAVAGIALTLAGEAEERRWLAWIGKPLASSAFVAYALTFDPTETRVGTLMLAAFVLSWIGDVLLLAKATSLFLAGLAAFLLAHLAFAAAFLSVPLPWRLTTFVFVLLTLVALIVVRWLWPHLKRQMRFPVSAYIIAIVAMVTLAIGAASAFDVPMLGIGAVLFFASDLLVARNRFIKRSFVNRAVGLPLYYAAQFSLASLLAALENV